MSKQKAKYPIGMCSGRFCDVQSKFLGATVYFQGHPFLWLSQGVHSLWWEVGQGGWGRALPFLPSRKSTIHHSFRTRAGLNFGRALKSAGNTGAASGRGHRFE